MFLSTFPKEQQAAFLNLAVTMINADKKISEEEKQIMSYYALEMDVDVSKAHVVDVEKELQIFDACTKTEKKKIFIELYAVALCDSSELPEEEIEIIKILQRRLEISDDVMQKMKDGLEKTFSAYQNLSNLVNE